MMIGWLKTATGALSGIFDRFWVWAYSVGAVIVLPLFPLFLQFAKNGALTKDDYLLTTAVLAASYVFTTETPFFRFWYAAVFMLTIVCDFPIKLTWLQIDVDRWAGTPLVVVALIHSVERFKWHMFLERPFPDARVGGEE